jgi:hypothetical protein
MQADVQQALNTAQTATTTTQALIGAADPSAHLTAHLKNYPSVQGLMKQAVTQVPLLMDAVAELQKAIKPSVLVDAAQAADQGKTVQPTSLGSPIDLATLKSATAKLAKGVNFADLVKNLEAVAMDTQLIADVNARYKAQGVPVDVAAVRGALSSVSPDTIPVLQQLSMVSQTLKREQASTPQEVHDALTHSESEINNALATTKTQLGAILGLLDSFLAKAFA